MKRLSIVTLLAAILATLGSLRATARTTAAGAFLNAPSTVIPMLDRNARLDMIDYYNSGSATPSRNQLNGRSRITEMDSNTVTIEMTDATVYRILLLPTKNDTVFAVISTAKLPAHDSDIQFFNNEWNRFVNQNLYFSQPSLDDWSRARSAADKEIVASQVPFVLSEYTYDENGNTLTVENRMSEFLAPKDWEKLKPLMREKFVYKWQPNRAAFVQQKQK